MSIFSTLKNVFANATIGHFKNYLSANFLIKAIGFLYIPVLTRLISPADYGIYNVFFSYLTIFGVLFTMNLHNSVNRYVFEDKSDLNEFMGSTFSGVTLILMVCCIPFLLFPNLISEWLNIPLKLVYLLFPLVLFTTMHSIFNQFFTAKEESTLVRNINFFYTLSQVIFSVIILLFIIDDNLYEGPVFGQIAAGFIFFLIIFSKLKKHIKPSLNWEHIVYMLKYSVPLIPGVLGGVILAHFDRIMILDINGDEKAGLYSFAYNIGALLIIVTDSLLQAWQPKFYRQMNQGNNSFLAKDFGMLFKVIIFASLGLIFFGKELGMILGAKEYNAAIEIVPVITGGYILFSLYKILEVQIAFTRQTFWISIIYIFCGVLNIVLNRIYLPEYGYEAGAWTTLVSFGAMALLTGLLNKFILKQYIPGLKPFLKAILTFLIGVSLFYYILSIEFSLIIEFLLKALIIGALVYILFSKEVKGFMANKLPSNS